MNLFTDEAIQQVKQLKINEANMMAMFNNPDFRRTKPLNQRQKRKRNRQNANSKFNRR